MKNDQTYSYWSVHYYATRFKDFNDYMSSDPNTSGWYILEGDCKTKALSIDDAIAITRSILKEHSNDVSITSAVEIN